MITDRVSIHSQAPTRIDLAGGTVDLWPLFLFLDDPMTVNLAIDLWAEAEVEVIPSRSNDGKITFISVDQGIEHTLQWNELNRAALAPGLILHQRLTDYFLNHQPGLKTWKEGQTNLPHFTLKTRAKSPAGAGLGGSSALAVAMVGALSRFSNLDQTDFDPQNEFFIDVVRDIETTVIQVPAGLQDYFGAMFGGLQALHWKIAQHRRVQLDPSALKGIADRTLLFYSGQSRNSGINNWALFKSFIDRSGATRDSFQSITDSARKLNEAIDARDWTRASQAIASEWSVRKTLASGISTAEIDRAFSLAQNESSEVSGKVCGAGGGGCFFIFVPSLDRDLMARIRGGIEGLGLRSLPFQAEACGLQVKVSRA